METKETAKADKTAFTPDFTLTVSKERGSDEKLEIGLRDIDEQTFLAANKLIQNDKELEAVRFLIRQLRVSGCAAEDICSNFFAIRSATAPLMEIIRPLEGSIKKN